MTLLRRLVIDTNVLVSAILLPTSVPRNTVDRALDGGVLLFSEATLAELATVLFRSKFDRYIGKERRQLFFEQLTSAAEPVPIIQLVRECRDPKDDKFLEVALNGGADAIVTGDADLLGMNPWHEIQILSPAEYLQI